MTTEKWQARGVMNGAVMLIVKDGLTDESPDWKLTTAMNEHGPDFICKVNMPAVGIEIVTGRERPIELMRAYKIAAAPEMEAVLKVLQAKMVEKEPMTWGDLQAVSAVLAKASGGKW